MNGNIFVTVRPPRGFGEDPSKIYHSPSALPRIIIWVSITGCAIWQADAVVHVGTHGSLEWLPGKNAGLNNTCYPDISLGDLPNIYPYLITITGEVFRPKTWCFLSDRTLPPPMTDAGVYDELEDEKLMDEYCHFETTQPGKFRKTSKLDFRKSSAGKFAG